MAAPDPARTARRPPDLCGWRKLACPSSSGCGVNAGLEAVCCGPGSFSFPSGRSVARPDGPTSPKVSAHAISVEDLGTPKQPDVLRRTLRCSLGSTRSKVAHLRRKVGCGSGASCAGRGYLGRDFGGPGRDRTDDLFHAMEARSQLRHRPTSGKTRGIELLQFSPTFPGESNSSRIMGV